MEEEGKVGKIFIWKYKLGQMRSRIIPYIPISLHTTFFRKYFPRIVALEISVSSDANSLQDVKGTLNLNILKISELSMSRVVKY